MIVHLIGDAHLGKKFEQGVPLHRRGDREKMVWDQFLAELEVDCDLNIQMGDIFDKMYVPYTVIFRAAMAYREAAQARPDTRFVVIRGNHDASRDADKVSAFQVFTELVRPFGVIVADDEAVDLDGHVIIPWHPFKTALEMLPEDLTDKTVYGHWDVVMGETNQIPAAELKARGAVAAYTGHDHNKRSMEIDGLPVFVTGSMQPYSHGEDEAGWLYVSVSLEEARTGSYVDKCVRVLLEPGETIDFPIDCLQLTRKRVGVEEDVGVEVQFEEFDFNELFSAAVADVGLSETMADKARQKLEEERART